MFSELSIEVQTLSTELGPYLRSLARRFGLSECDTADVLQEALLAFYMHRSRIEEPKRWLMIVLKHESLRIVRNRPARTVSFEDLPVGSISSLSTSATAGIDRRLRLGRLVADLSPRNRRVLWMRFVADMSWIEIARDLSCRPGGAKKAVHRAVTAARERASAGESLGAREALVQES